MITTEAEMDVAAASQIQSMKDFFSAGGYGNLNAVDGGGDYFDLTNPRLFIITSEKSFMGVFLMKMLPDGDIDIDQQYDPITLN